MLVLFVVLYRLGQASRMRMMHRLPTIHFIRDASMHCLLTCTVATFMIYAQLLVASAGLVQGCTAVNTRNVLVRKSLSSLKLFR